MLLTCIVSQSIRSRYWDLLFSFLAIIVAPQDTGYYAYLFREKTYSVES